MSWQSRNLLSVDKEEDRGLHFDGDKNIEYFRELYQTSQELRMLSTVTLNCQVTMIVTN